MKETSKNRTEWKKAYHSLSRLLRDSQMKSAMAITAPIFSAIGLPISGKVKPADVLGLLSPDQWDVNKKGEKFPCYMAKKVITKEVDVEGQTVRVPVLDAQGNKQYTYDLKPIHEGQWTMDKLVSLVATAYAMK